MAGATTILTITIWLLLRELIKFKISGVLAQTNFREMHESLNDIPDGALKPMDEAEFERVFNDESPEDIIEMTWRAQQLSVSDNRRSKKVDVSPVQNFLPPRRYNSQPMVEIGPGAFKFDAVTYPPKYLQMNLNKLMKLKQKMEERDKALNQDQMTSTAGQRPPPRFSTMNGPALPASRLLPRPLPDRRST